MSNEPLSSASEKHSKRKTFETIKAMPYCDPSKRMDFILFFEVHQGNPNGDPDAGNLPRIDPTDNHGIVTDVATKRKIRDYLQTAHERAIFIQNKTALNTLYFREARAVAAADSGVDVGDRDSVMSLAAILDAEDGDSSPFAKLLDEELQVEVEGDKIKKTVKELLIDHPLENSDFDGTVFSYLGENKDANKIGDDLVGDLEVPDVLKALIKRSRTGLAALLAKAKKTPERQGLEVMKRRMCKEFDDIRLFGAVLTAGTNAGQIRGPMQLTFARSLKPIIPIESSITRIAITKASDFLRKQTEMGRKPWVSWAAYEQHGFYNAPLGAAPAAGGTGVTREDLARFWEAIANMFPEAKSAANGLMNVCDLIVFVHEDEKGRGCAPFHLLRKKVSLTEKSGTTEFTKGFDQVYEAVTVESKDKLLQAGITVHRPLEHLWPDLR